MVRNSILELAFPKLIIYLTFRIIVGVKYCFRYNQRARQAMIDNESGEPIDLNNMPRARRRREKKLMSMEEVNERFPLTKYKLWRATREHEGLPSTGGVTAPSRAGSIKDGALSRISSEPGASVEILQLPETAEALIPASAPANHDPSSETRDFAEIPLSQSSRDVKEISLQEKQTSGIGVEESDPSVSEKDEPKNASTHLTTNADAEAEAEAGEEDEDDPIRTAVRPELLTQPGDACAICLDNLDEDDEVRGLTCGHAFHAGCLDPWLTSRRACCPLCKANYYVPKPRPEGESADDRTSRGDVRSTGSNAPVNAWMGGRGGMSFRPRVVLAGSTFHADPEHQPRRFAFHVASRRNRYQRPGNMTSTAASAAPGQTGFEAPPRPQRSRFASMRSSFPQMPALRFPSLSTPPRNTVESNTTPAQLEAGAR